MPSVIPSQNMSPFDQEIVIVSYNGVQNSLLSVALPCPDFLSGRDFIPPVPLVEQQLVTQVSIVHSSLMVPGKAMRPESHTLSA